MDLKQFRPGIYFLHFIDLFTRYSLAKVIRRKLPEVTISEVVMVWLASGFGPPEKCLIDNETETEVDGSLKSLRMRIKENLWNNLI